MEELISERERAVFYTTRFGKRSEAAEEARRPRTRHFEAAEAAEDQLDQALITKALGLQMLTKGKLLYLAFRLY